MTQARPAPLDIKLMNITASVLFVAFALLVAGSLVRWVSRQPVFAIGGIAVTGDVTHSNAATLRANVAPRLGGTFFTLDLAQARAAFESVPWVRQAVVKRSFPNHLKVALQEHQAVAYWGVEGDTMLVNSYGEVFEANSGEIEQEDLPRLSGPDGQALAVWEMYKTLPMPPWTWFWSSSNSPRVVAGAPDLTPALKWSWGVVQTMKCWRVPGGFLKQ